MTKEITITFEVDTSISPEQLHEWLCQTIYHNNRDIAQIPAPENTIVDIAIKE